MDQTTFTTDEYADEVERQLKLDGARRVLEGYAFKLVLTTRLSFEDDDREGKFTLLIDRVKSGTVFVHANGDSVYDTWARIVSGGDAFRITIAIPRDDSDVKKATIHVAPEMKRVVDEFIASQDRVS